MHVALTAALALALCATPATVVADDPTCAGRASLQVDVAPTPFDPKLAKQLLAQLLHEIGKSACADGAPATRIVITWPDADHAAVSVEVRAPHGSQSATRVLDLKGLPSDGRSVALTIAATELLDGVSAQLDAARPKTAPLVPPVPIVPKRSLPTTPVERLGAFGPRVSFDAFTRGVALLGTDAQLSIALSTRLSSTIHVGVRAPLSAGARHESTYVLGAEFSAAPWSLARRWGPLAQLRVDALLMPADTEPARASVFVPAVGAGLWLRAGGRSRVTVQTSVGVPSSPSASAGTLGLFISAGVAIEANF